VVVSICKDAYVGIDICGGGIDVDDVGGVDVERNADVTFPLPSRCIDSSIVPDMV